MWRRAVSDKVERLEQLRPIVAIVGRPNVGKSTLLNRLAGGRHAITDDQPGVTRDRVYVEVEWSGRRFTMVDTGGYVSGSADAMEAAVRGQAEEALEEADIVIFLCDGATGVTSIDRDVADLLRRRDTPCLLAVNKMDHPEQQRYEGEFYSLGLGDPVPVSAATGRRSGDLLEAVIARFDELDLPGEEEEGELIRVAIAGRPNVGKSTLTNQLAGYRVSIVSDQPGTTRDTTGIRLAWGGRRFLIMDTAGLRRRSRIDTQVEYYSVLRASSSIEEADVVLVLVDGDEGLASQDARIMRLVADAGRAMLVVVNKWDLVDRSESPAEAFRAELHRQLPFLVDYPSVFVSALTGRRVGRCLESVARVYDTWRARIPTARLNRWVEEVGRRLGPAGSAGGARVLYVTQQGTAPPSFVVFCDHPERVEVSYRRFLANSLREEFGFAGSPLKIAWRSRRSKGGRSRRAAAPAPDTQT